MKTVSENTELRAQINRWKKEGQIVAFVPTMGNLHDGHLSLVEQAKKLADKTVTSIFVNPLQFGKNEDLDSYPRTLSDDQEKLSGLDCDLLYLPTVDQVYPNGMDLHATVTVPGISEILCGASRPGHFQGVATVVAKLFNLVQPHVAVFGEKDYQQLQVIRKMVEDLAFPIEIVGVPTARNQQGLALSSRNGYLSEAEREKASQLFQTLQATKESIVAGKDNFQAMEKEAIASLSNLGFNVDYFKILSRPWLRSVTSNDKQLIILVAAFLGQTRLIDNLVVDY